MMVVACQIGKLLIHIIQLSQVGIIVHRGPHLYGFVIILSLDIGEDFLYPRVISRLKDHV